MTSARSELEAAYARTLLPLARSWRRSADGALRGMGVSAAAGWALVQISRLGDGVRQTDLADALEITAASLVRVLDTMAAGGLIDRQRDPADARVSRVRLTPAGQALVRRTEAALATLRGEALADIPDADLATALRVAKQLEARVVRERRR